MTVAIRTGGQDRPLGETGARGTMDVLAALFGLEPGTPTMAYATVCPDRRSVTLVPPGETFEPACRRIAAERPECSCGVVGEMVWGDDVVLDLSTGRVAVRPEAERRRPEPVRRPERREPEPVSAPRPPADRPAFFLALGGGFGVWPNLERGCDHQPAPPQVSCDVSDGAPTVRAAAEYRFRPDLGVGLDVGYTTGLSIEQEFQRTGDPLAAVAHAVDMDVVTLGGHGTAALAVSPAADLFAALGFLWAINTATATTTFDFPERRATAERSGSGGRITGRAGVEWWSGGRRWGLRIEAGGMTGGSDDIDTTWFALARVLVPLGAR